MSNIIKLTDSYKFSHWKTYPQGTEKVHSYMSSRGGEYDEMVFHGLAYYLKKYLSEEVGGIDIHDAEENAKKHGVPFNEDGWIYIYSKLQGKLPVIIKALPEGSIFKPHDVILTIENTDPNCAWLTSYLETLLLKIWYPITIATKSYHVKKMLKGYWDKTSDNPDGVDFAYHNFGDRGSSSVESAAIGGVAHLTQFKGTDNFNCLDLSNDYYDGKYQGFSIPATEHSTVTSWGKDNEFEMIENYLETYKDQPIIACVLDSYDIYKAVDFVTSGRMKEKIESDDYPIFVIRPDSGDPIKVIMKILEIMEKNKVSFSINSKGYLVFDKYKILWGDGVTTTKFSSHGIERIIDFFCTKDKHCFIYDDKTLSAENFAFGSGGDLMQNLNRDTCKFAIKASAIKVDGKWWDIYKEPITDKGKTSLRGRQDHDKLITVFEDGEVK